MDARIQAFAELLEAEAREFTAREYPGTPQNCIDANCAVNVRPGRKYTKVDIGSSGRYMVDAEGNIWGIKAYGVIHRGYLYGTLDTINEWYWGGYRAFKKPVAKFEVV